jgi:hypothetical protein
MTAQTREVRKYLLQVHGVLFDLGRKDLAALIMMIGVTDAGGDTQKLYKIVTDFYLEAIAKNHHDE